MSLSQRLAGFFVPMGETRLERPRPTDWALGAALLALAALEILVDSGFGGRAPAAVTATVGVGAFIYRRVRPLVAVLVIGGIALSINTFALVRDAEVNTTAAEVLATAAIIYAAGRWGNAKTILWAAIQTVVVIPTTANLNPLLAPSVSATLIEALATSLVLVVGLMVRAVIDGRHQRALADALNERNQLANDIHDSFAHHMSAIAIRAEAARQLDEPAAVDEALQAIKKSASTGLADLRHFVVMLRTPDDNAQPLPGLGDIRSLAAELTTATVTIDTHLDANPELIPVTVSAASYSITREALTNVYRHARGATLATVRANLASHHLDISISDNGNSPNLHSDRNGHGLRSMTARARSLGGELTAGPHPNGGWLVAARLPLDGGNP